MCDVSDGRFRVGDAALIATSRRTFSQVRYREVGTRCRRAREVSTKPCAYRSRLPRRRHRTFQVLQGPWDQVGRAGTECPLLSGIAKALAHGRGGGRGEAGWLKREATDSCLRHLRRAAAGRKALRSQDDPDLNCHSFGSTCESQFSHKGYSSSAGTLSRVIMVQLAWKRHFRATQGLSFACSDGEEWGRAGASSAGEREREPLARYVEPMVRLRGVLVPAVGGQSDMLAQPWVASVNFTTLE